MAHNKRGRISFREIEEIIISGIAQNNLDIKSVHQIKFKYVIYNYLILCSKLLDLHSIAELDTFKRAACLAIAMNMSHLAKDERTNAKIAVDATCKMCEKPYWDHCKINDIPTKMPEICLSECIPGNEQEFMRIKYKLIQKLLAKEKDPMFLEHYYELFYMLGLKTSQQKLRSEQHTEIENSSLSM